MCTCKSKSIKAEFCLFAYDYKYMVPSYVLQVAFIGISNWALDPAKMNRGILVQREVPDIEELKNSAE